jgi:hypothetical protein
MESEWLFRNLDGTRDEAFIEGPLPTPGDGKFHNGKGYRVVGILSGRITTPRDFVLADEHD